MQSHSQTTYPKREQRAVWMATVSNVDYPSSSSLSVVSQKNEFIANLEKFKQVGINVVYMQIRPSCDAFYNNPNEPWSQWLNGTQGMPPNPFYDPLEFYINEAHKRGMELHAWINPYRSVVNIMSSSISASHISVQQPSWNVTYNTLKILNPGLQAVRNYVSNVIMYIVNNYDIDGIHFDDYFYPYPQSGYVFNDADAFAADPRGFTNLNDWRRDNVNLFIGMVHDSIKAAKNHVKFGVSPFGIWKSGTPAGITGLSSYYDIYCDPIDWLTRQKIDYILPQLYWAIGGSQDFNALSNWWGNQAQQNGRHCYAGIATYRLSSSNWSSTEIRNQINSVRTINNKVEGYSFFSATQIKNNIKGINDTLINNLHKYKCLVPTMPWLDSIKPNPPQNINVSVASNYVNLSWQLPPAAADGDSAKYFVIYRFPNGSLVDLDNATAIVGITAQDTTGFKETYTIPSGGSVLYTITGCDRLHNESNSVYITACNNCGAPANNDCIEAIELFSNTNCIYTSGTLTGATCSYPQKASCDAFGNPAKKDVFYYFTALNPDHTIEVKPTGSGADAVDAVISVYEGDDCTALTEIACGGGNGGSGGITKTIQLSNLIPGNQYWIRIYDYGSIDPVYPDFEICITSPSLTFVSNAWYPKDNFILYPNPAHDFFQILSEGTVTDVIIRNATGQALLHVRNTGINEQLSTSTLPSGFYLVELRNEHESTFRKLIIQK